MPGYQLHVVTLRDAIADDRTRIDVERTLVGATRVVRTSRGNRQRLAAALAPLKEAAATARALKDVEAVTMAARALVFLDPKSAMEILGIASVPGTTPLYYSGGYHRGHSNIRKRLLIDTAGFNLGLLMRRLIGVGTPRGLQGRLSEIVAILLTLTRSLWKLVRGQGGRPHNAFYRSSMA